MNRQPEEEKSIDLETTNSTLPSRREYHQKKKKKTTFKIKYPIVRLLALLFVLLPVAILSYKFMSEPGEIDTNPVKRSTNFESLDYETEDEADQQPKEEIIEEPEPVEIKSEASITPKEEEPLVAAEQESLPIETTKQNVDDNNPPSSNEETKQTKPKQEKPKDRYDVKYHKVQAEENLYRISMKYYNNRSGENLIKRWNNLDGHTVIEGQVLQIPIKIN